MLKRVDGLLKQGYRAEQRLVYGHKVVRLQHFSENISHAKGVKVILRTPVRSNRGPSSTA